jgi:hypothetical protein
MLVRKQNKVSSELTTQVGHMGWSIGLVTVRLLT